MSEEALDGWVSPICGDAIHVTDDRGGNWIIACLGSPDDEEHGPYHLGEIVWPREESDGTVDGDTGDAAGKAGAMAPGEG